MVFLIWESSLLYFLVFCTEKKATINKLLLVFLKNRRKQGSMFSPHFSYLCAKYRGVSESIQCAMTSSCLENTGSLFLYGVKCF